MANVPAVNEARPAYLQQYFGDRDDDDFDIPGGKSIAIIAPKNNIWRLKFAKQVIDIEDERGQPRPHLDVAFAAAAKELARIWFQDPWKSDSNNRPDCASIDGVHPDAGVPNRQHANCNECRWDVFGSAKQGGGKDCKQNKRLVALPVVGDPMHGGQLIDNQQFNGGMLFRVMPGSFGNWNAFRAELKANGRKLFDGVIRLEFDRNTNGVITFRWLRWLTEAEVALSLACYNDEHTKRILSLDATAVPAEDIYDEDEEEDTTRKPVVTPAVGPATPTPRTRKKPEPAPTPEPTPSPAQTTRPRGNTFGPAPTPPAATGNGGGTFAKPRQPQPAPTPEIVDDLPNGNGEVPEAASGFTSTADIIHGIDQIAIPDY